MATILLDTQVLVWLLNGSKSLGPKALKLARDPSNRLLVSYFSLFEVAIKASIGKMTYDDSVIDDFAGMGIELIAPGREPLRRYQMFNPDNKDPFDNILIAVALTEDCRFMTSDAKILSSPVSGLKLINAKL